MKDKEKLEIVNSILDSISKLQNNDFCIDSNICAEIQDKMIEVRNFMYSFNPYLFTYNEWCDRFSSTIDNIVSLNNEINFIIKYVNNNKNKCKLSITNEQISLRELDFNQILITIYIDDAYNDKDRNKFILNKLYNEIDDPQVKGILLAEALKIK